MEDHTSRPDVLLRRFVAEDDALDPQPKRAVGARLTGVALGVAATVAVGALVMTSSFGPRDPLFTAAATGAAPGVSEAAALADQSRIALWINYDYVAGPGLGTEGGSGGVYQLQRIGTPEDVLADMAERFGVDGPVGETSYFDPAWPSYVVGPQDGSGPSIAVTWSGTGNWWYNNPTAYPEPACTLVNYETDNGTEQFEECIAPEVPASESLAPSETEARVEAAALFSSMGLDVEPGDVRVTADAWQTMATANLVVDGVSTAIDYGVAWSPLGDIAWAYGHSIEVVERGDFGTVSATSAVDRLDDGRWYGAGGPDYQGGMNLLPADSGVARDAVPAPDAPAEPSMAPAPMPEPEQVTVTVDSAEATLLLMWDAEGNAWLVPGYAMQHPDGFWNTIVSLADGVIELPEPVVGQIEPFFER